MGTGGTTRGEMRTKMGKQELLNQIEGAWERFSWFDPARKKKPPYEENGGYSGGFGLDLVVAM